VTANLIVSINGDKMHVRTSSSFSSQKKKCQRVVASHFFFQVTGKRSSRRFYGCFSSFSSAAAQLPRYRY